MARADHRRTCVIAVSIAEVAGRRYTRSCAADETGERTLTPTEVDMAAVVRELAVATGAGLRVQWLGFRGDDGRCTVVRCPEKRDGGVEAD